MCGVDKAGRGPLAGPVVVGEVRMRSSSSDAAVVVEGIADSTKITSESHRQRLYEQRIQPNITTTVRGTTGSDAMTNLWVVAMIDATTIDEINVLQATMLGMRTVAAVLTGRAIQYPTVPIQEFPNGVTLPGCYVLVPNGVVLSEPLPMDAECGQYQVVEQGESY